MVVFRFTSINPIIIFPINFLPRFKSLVEGSVRAFYMGLRRRGPMMDGARLDHPDGYALRAIPNSAPIKKIPIIWLLSPSRDKINHITRKRGKR